METVEFRVFEDFEQGLADRFMAFLSGLKNPCQIVIEIESVGGYVYVLEQMETAIKAKKEEGYVFITNVEEYAYSCGLFLFLLGDIKLCSETAQFMYHSSGFKLENERVTSSDLMDMLAILEADDLFTNRILAENTTIQPGMLEILKKNDNFLSKADLIYLGFMEPEYELN